MFGRSVANNRRIISNPFTQGVLNYTNITGSFHRRLKHLPISNINIPIHDAENDCIGSSLSNNIYVNGSLHSKEDIILLDNMESLFNATKQTLPRWNYIDNQNNIEYTSQRIIKIARDVLTILGGDNIIGLLSNVLNEWEIINMKPIRNMLNSMKAYYNDNENNKSKLLQLIAPYIKHKTLNAFGFDMKYETHKKSKQRFKAQNEIIIFDRKESRGRPSKKDNPIIQQDVYSHCMLNSGFRHQQLMVRATIKFGRDIYARQLEMSRNMLWKCYPNKHQIGRTVFDAIVEYFDQFKDGRKRTDLCEICGGEYTLWKRI